MNRKLPIYKIVPLECDFLEIAVVDNPAIEEYFLMFNEEPIKMEFNSDQQIIKGPVMIPNKLIYRNDKLGERFVTYDEEGIQLSATLFLKNGFKFNADHTTELLPIQIIESYFAIEPNEFNVPKGSWIVSAKVNDNNLWNEFKTNEKGFSFQSMFSNELIGTEEINFNKNNNEMDLKEKIMAAVNTVLFGVEEVVENVEKAEEFAVDPNEPVENSRFIKEAVQLTPEVNQSMIDASVLAASEQILISVKEMIDASVLAASEQILISVKEMLGQGTEDIASEMAKMEAKIEEFGKQPLSVPVIEAIENKSELTTSNSKYDSFRDLKNK